MSKEVRSVLKEVLMSAKSSLRRARGKRYGEKQNAKDPPGEDSGPADSAAGALPGLEKAEGEVRTEMAVSGAGLADEMKDFMSNRVKRPKKKTAKGKPMNMIIAEAKNPNKTPKKKG